MEEGSPPERRRTGSAGSDGEDQQGRVEELDQEKSPEATLKVPYTVGSTLRDRIQKVENEYSNLLRCKKIRIVEGGETSSSTPWEEITPGQPNKDAVIKSARPAQAECG